MRHRREEKGKKFMVYFIGFVMVASIFGVIFFGFGGNSMNSTREKGITFVNNGNSWSATIDGREALFAYVPSQVEQIPVEGNIIDRFKNAIEIDMTYDFNDTYAEQIALAQFQMGTTLNNFNIFLRNGFTSESGNFPVITCEDSTSFVPVIYFKSSNETKVYLKNECIIAEAANELDVLRIKDRLVYGLLGIIK